MKNSTLLTATAAVAIVAVAGIGGYLVDKKSTNETPVAAVSGATPQMVAPPSQNPGGPGGTGKMAAAKPAATTRSTASVTPAAKPQAPQTARTEPDTISNNELVAMSGTVTDKHGNTLMLKDPKGLVRVLVREQSPRPWDVGAPLAMDRIDVGDKVTVYGKVSTTDAMPKVTADAVYDAGTKTLYYVNPSKQPDAMTAAAITAPYQPVRGANSAHITATKVAVTKR